MKRALLSIVVVLIAVVGYAQTDDGRRWSPEFSVKAFVSIYHSSYDITAGARINYSVFGLGSGYGTEYWDAYPANVKKIPLYCFCRQYIPIGEYKRFLLFGEVTLGGECVYKISGNAHYATDFKQTPYCYWRTSFTPGIALRLFEKSSIYIAPTFESINFFGHMWGITAGLNIGF